MPAARHGRIDRPGRGVWLCVGVVAAACQRPRLVMSIRLGATTLGEGALEMGTEEIDEQTYVPTRKETPSSRRDGEAIDRRERKRSGTWAQACVGKRKGARTCVCAGWQLGP